MRKKPGSPGFFFFSSLRVNAHARRALVGM
jgi:hypothetical protein